MFKKDIKPNIRIGNLSGTEPIKTYWKFEVVYCDSLLEKVDYVIAEKITAEDGNLLFHIGGKVVGIVPQKNIYKVVRAEKYQKTELHDMPNHELEEKLQEIRNNLDQIMYETQRRYEGGERRCF